MYVLFILHPCAMIGQTSPSQIAASKNTCIVHFARHTNEQSNILKLRELQFITLRKGNITPLCQMIYKHINCIFFLTTTHRKIWWQKETKRQTQKKHKRRWKETKKQDRYTITLWLPCLDGLIQTRGKIARVKKSARILLLTRAQGRR